MKNILKKIIAQARENPKKIVFPEATESRILRASNLLAKKGIAKPILLGNTHLIKTEIRKEEVSCCLKFPWWSLRSCQ